MQLNTRIEVDIRRNKVHGTCKTGFLYHVAFFSFSTLYSHASLGLIERLIYYHVAYLETKVEINAAS